MAPAAPGRRPNMEFVVGALVVVVVAQSALLGVIFRGLLRAAMSRTPGEFRKMELEAKKPKADPAPKVSQVDEAAAMVLSSFNEAVPYSPQPTMPHGLGGA